MRLLIVVFFIFLAAGNAPAHAQTAYALQPGDSIQVWMAQSQDLRREITIGPDGNVSLPLAGHIHAEGLTLQQLEEAVRTRLKPLFKQVDLTLMLRPAHEPVIYVVGEVTTPGSFPYRSGMTVLHAVSVAGGIYRAAILPADQDRSVLVARQIEDAEQSMRELSARILRLEAEIAGRKSIIAADGGAVDPLLAQEQALMEARQLSVSTMEEAETQSERLNERNAQALQEQMATLTHRVALSKERLESISALIARGGAESSLSNRQQAEIAELEGQISRLAADIVVSERAAAAESARYKAARQDRKTQLLTELQATRRAREETAQRLSDNQRIMSIYGASTAAAQDRAQRSLDYTILRIQDGNPVELEVTETSSLQPGDLLRVRYHGGPLVEQSSEHRGVNPIAMSSAQSPPLIREAAQ